MRQPKTSAGATEQTSGSRHPTTRDRAGTVAPGGNGEPYTQIQLRDAKATLSAVIDNAVRGEPSVITRHGRPEAVVLGFEDWQRLSSVPSFGRLLMASGLSDDELPERNAGPLPDVDL